MLKFIRARLEIKILLLIVSVLIAGFGSYVVISIQKESKAMLQQHHEQLKLFSETIMAGIRNVMLTGKSPAAFAFVNDARENLSFGSLTIYDRFGKEVFLREGEGIDKNVNDPLVLSALSTHQSQSAMIKENGAEAFVRYEPLMNHPECWRCHDQQYQMRGVIELALKPTIIPSHNSEEAEHLIAGTIGNFIASAFRTIMLGGKGDQMDTLMYSAKQVPGVQQVKVYRRTGELAFGDDDDDVPQKRILDLIRKESPEIQYEDFGRNLRLFIPLVNQERCQVCHGAKYPMRGVVVIDYSKDSLKSILSSPTQKFTSVIQQTVFAGLRSIMLVGKASSVRVYADELSHLDVLQTLRIFDRDGYERFLNPPARKRKELQDVLKNKTPVEFVENVDGEESMVRLSPLANETRCYACHGTNHDIRAVVEVSASMKMINDTINDNKIRSAGVGIVTLLLIWAVIRMFMRTVVVKPVQLIEGVANRVGHGDLSVEAMVSSDDEIGRLAARINEMVQGLRERLHLTKFVSQQTVDAVRSADSMGVQLGGERKVATVFFSDIRGFTSYSEKVAPEQVVSMLNDILSRQTAIVKRYGGDIDKYVGDELVAVFLGDNMVENAVRAAIEIQHELEAEMRNKTEDAVHIGIGINTGEMVMGAMGSMERMDFTVIGDNVNLGARLCSAANGGEILISEYSASYITGHPEFELIQLEPLSVKGKQAPVKVCKVVKKV